MKRAPFYVLALGAAVALAVLRFDPGGGGDAGIGDFVAVTPESRRAAAINLSAGDLPGTSEVAWLGAGALLDGARDCAAARRHAGTAEVFESPALISGTLEGGTIFRSAVVERGPSARPAAALQALRGRGFACLAEQLRTNYEAWTGAGGEWLSNVTVARLREGGLDGGLALRARGLILRDRETHRTWIDNFVRPIGDAELILTVTSFERPPRRNYERWLIDLLLRRAQRQAGLPAADC